MENKNQRMHGLDTYRAVLMILGVVLHTAVVYGFDKIIDSIHTFRMPGFFLLSGYFGALLWYRRGVEMMVKNRIRRLCLPFLVFVFALYPINTLFWSYLDGLNRGIANPLEYSIRFTFDNFFPLTDLMHLWFLYYLIFVIFFVLTIVLWIERFSYSSPYILKKLKEIFEGGWSFLIFVGVINFGWGLLFKWDDIPTDSRWIPNLLIISYYAIFYSLGWLFYTTKVEFFSFKKNAWSFLIIGIISSYFHSSLDHLFVGYDYKKSIILQWEMVFWFSVKVFLGTIALVGLVRGFLGIFLKYCSSDSRIWRYVSDSSYWIFLIHITICPLMPVFFITLKIAVWIKFFISFIIVFFICLVTYDAFVRSTFIGNFLNGRRFPSFKRKESIILCVVIGIITLYFIQNPPLVMDRPSPWLDGKTPVELLPDKDVTYPLDKKYTSLAGVGLIRCARINNYVICPDGAKFEDAKSSCSLLGGKMASFEDELKYKSVQKWLKKIYKRRMWVGITDSHREGTWVWVNKENLHYEFWANGEPNNWGKGEDCAEVYLWEKKPRWNDISCESNLGFICEL